MHLLKTFEQTAVFDPTNPNQRVIAQRIGVPGGWGSFYFNQIPTTANLNGLGAGGFSGLPAWAQIGIVLAGSTAAGYFAMQRFGTGYIKPALRKVGINLSGPRSRRRR